MILYDTVDVARPRLTKDGYLVAEARVARTGIQLYTAGELGMDGDPARQIRVYRSPDEVFAADAMASYAHRPITIDHPSRMVDAANWKDVARGQTGGDVIRDGDFVRVPLVLLDHSAITQFKEGRSQLSMGYEMDLVVGDGMTPAGEKFDASQKNLRMNHLALVSRARGGSQLRLGDETLEDLHMPETKLTTVLVDGLSVETTDAGAQAISKISKELADSRQLLLNAEAKSAEAIAVKDKELAAKDATIDDLKGKVLSDKDLDAKVTARADLITKAKSIADKDYTGKAADDIRKTAVIAKLGADAVTDKSPEYIAARFDILAEDADQDPVRKVLRTGDVHSAGDAVSKAYASMVSDMSNAWQTKTKEVA